MDVDRISLQGIYLVIDPSMKRQPLLQKIRKAVKGGVNLLQIWNHWPDNAGREGKEAFIRSVTAIAHSHSVPVLINDEWQLLESTPLDGVHFDTIPKNLQQIRLAIGRDFLAGITCTNNLSVVDWAQRHDMDYISFCALFPSPSAGNCEIVHPETVRKARRQTDLPLFLSGGITPENLKKLSSLPFDGIAVISGILAGDAPLKKTDDYKQVLINLNKNS